MQFNNQNKRFRNKTRSEITEFNNFQRVDSTFTTDVKKLLTRQVLGTSLPKFSGDVAQWPSFLATYRRLERKGRVKNINNQPVRVKSSKNQEKPFEDRTKNTQCRICHSGQNELIHCRELIKANVK
jgi:hypothetical protein